MVFTGNPLSAEDAYRFGLLNRYRSDLREGRHWAGGTLAEALLAPISGSDAIISIIKMRQLMRTRTGEVSDGIPLPIPCRPDKIPLPTGALNLAQVIDIAGVVHELREFRAPRRIFSLRAGISVSNAKPSRAAITEIPWRPISPLRMTMSPGRRCWARR